MVYYQRPLGEEGQEVIKDSTVGFRPLQLSHSLSVIHGELWGSGQRWGLNVNQLIQVGKQGWDSGAT